ncbi:sensor histidine kinase [Microbacterium telephonicum]|uniref:histidine kinase n=1 Tax=Microbacterium telephonicum TaxID=1714841 RepID=A0A498BZV3_9MICO|nr:HAMP domain-containing sensor histidine kinase [Microbacterium telephonicum]RLK48972.1 two-component system OmpR family sensor kinase [Microbacterium telephonicum]
MTAATEPASATPQPRRPRVRWSLQTRLMTAIIGMVALILAAAAFATSAILGGILQQDLDNSLREPTTTAAQQLAHPFPPTATTPTAVEVLDATRTEPGFLFLYRGQEGLDGAYVDQQNEVHALTPAQLSELSSLTTRDAFTTVDIDGLGAYRLGFYNAGGTFVVGGLPLTKVSATITQIISTTLLVTLAGLMALAGAIALIIRRSLRPLRAVADTATRVAAIPLAEGAVSITERVPDADTDDHTEIGRVGLALNTLLDHVDTSLAARQRNEDRMRAFVADASHELRTPLASIRGYSELSLRGIRQQRERAGGADGAGGAARVVDPVAEVTQSSLERIQAQSLRMTTLVEDLLLLARLDEGTELVYGAVDLTRLSIDAVADAQVAGPDHEWELAVGDDPVVVAGDTGRLQQVAVNLLANARVHTPAGTHVTASVGVEDGAAVLRVHDDGPGIDPDVADVLFERFARADSSRARKTGGTGLGLSIVKAIVDAHHGTITVDSEPGSTTFTVRLPARPHAPEA